MDLEGENATKYRYLNYFVEVLFILLLQCKMTNSVDKVGQYNDLSFKIRIWRLFSLWIFGPTAIIFSGLESRFRAFVPSHEMFGQSPNSGPSRNSAKSTVFDTYGIFYDLKGDFYDILWFFMTQTDFYDFLWLFMIFLILDTLKLSVIGPTKNGF